MYLASLLVVFALFLEVQPWANHTVSPERVEVNRKIKARFSQIDRSETIPGGHLNNSETVDDILKAIGKNDQRFFRDVVLLKGINAVVANNLSQQANVTSNELSSSLPDSGQFGELNQEDERYLFAILKSLATAYRDTFKQDYGIVKEIHVIPIAEYSITDINHVVKRCVVGVLHKVDGRLSGIAALLVNFTMPVVG